MTTDPERRVREYIAALKVPAAPPIALIVGARRRPAARLVPVAAALAVLAVIALSLVHPGGAPVAGGGGTPGLPDRFASYSVLTASVSKSPPGKAIALYQHGLNFGRGDRAQTVVLGAYDDVYRRLDLAESADGDPIAALLSPDGTHAVAGSRNGSNDLRLIDLSTGESEKLPTWKQPRQSLSPMAWSPDGRHLVVLCEGESEPPEAVLYDLTTRDRPTALPQGLSWATAFSPEGTRLAFHSDGGLHVIDLNTHETVALPIPDDTPRSVRLAWSPDGQLLAGTDTDDHVYFVDATGSGRPVPVPVRIDLAHVLAWTGDRTILVSRNGFVEVNVDTGQSRRLSVFDESRVWPAEQHELGLISFATNLMIGVQSRPADTWPDRGPWPAWLRLATFVSIVLLLAAATLLVGRVRRRR